MMLHRWKKQSKILQAAWALALFVIAILFYNETFSWRYMMPDWLFSWNSVYSSEQGNLGYVDVEENADGILITHSNDSNVNFGIRFGRYVDEIQVHGDGIETTIPVTVYYMTRQEPYYSEDRTILATLTAENTTISLQQIEDRIYGIRLDFDVEGDVSLFHLSDVTVCYAKPFSRGLALAIWMLLFIGFICSIKRKRLKSFAAILSRLILSFDILFAGFWILERNVFGEEALKSIGDDYLRKNLILHGIIYVTLFVLCNRWRWASVFYLMLCNVCGILDGFVYLCRGYPVQPQDISSIGAAVAVSGNYEFVWQTEAVRGLGISVLLCLLLLQSKEIKIANGSTRWQVAVLYLCTIIMMIESAYVSDSISTNWELKTNTFEPNKQYSEQGILVALLSDVKSMRVAVPEDYDLHSVESLLDSYQQQTVEDIAENVSDLDVVVIMNESFSDLSVVGDFETNQDYMPYIHSLSENVITGYTYVSTFGGGTTNSEYEFLTGNSRAFMPQMGYVYVNANTPSLVTAMKGQGYYTVGFHPYLSVGYRRSSVWRDLQFDQTIFLEDLKTMKETSDLRFQGNYMSDEGDFTYLNSVLDSTSVNTFVFNTTMQNHGNFDAGIHGDMNDIAVVAPQELTDNEALNVYLNLVYQTDEAFEELISGYEQSQQPTIVLLFGDHQPALGDDVYNTLLASGTYASELERLEAKQMTPFVIWANFDIEEQQGVSISLNYLAAYLCDVAGIENTAYSKYLLDLYEQVPVINCYGYLGNDGNWYDLGQESPYKELVDQYQNVEYYAIFDKHRDESYFLLQE